MLSARTRPAAAKQRIECGALAVVIIVIQNVFGLKNSLCVFVQ